MSLATAAPAEPAEQLRLVAKAGIPLPTRRLALVVAVTAPVWLISGAEVGASLVAIILLGLLALVGSEIVTSPPPDAVTVTRRLPSTLGLGERSEAWYSVGSNWPRALLVRVVDALPRGLQGERGSPLPLRVDPFSVATAAIPIEAVARGRYELGPVALLVTGRFGLTQHWFRFSDEARIVIAPSITVARKFRLQALEARTTQTGERALRRRGESLSLAGLRAYVHGDDPRLIDWKATARQRSPVVREFSLEQGQTVLLAVDAGRMMTQIEDGRPRFEFALSSALVLAAVAADGGDRVGVLLFDDMIRAYVPPMKGIAAVNRIREVLIEAQPSLVEPDYAAAFATIASRQRRRALVVVFTDVIDPRSSRALVLHAAAGMRRHLALVVALRNESLARAAWPRVSEGENAAGRAPQVGAVRDVYRSAAAEELLLARAEALQRMRQSGATVLDVRPTAMTAAVINRYLDLKARGAL
jgi:uncharacterized protein (DUF58 family)